MLSAVVVLAAAAVSEQRELSARRTDTPPVIDGHVDADEWKGAAFTPDFTQKFPQEGAEPSEQTTLRLFYDDQAVYVAFECHQRTSPIVGRLAQRDSPVVSDSVTIELGSRGDGRSAFEFGVNVAGVLTDGLRYNDTQFSAEWDENWQASTARTGDGWSAEFRIPLRILRFASAREQSWDFQARRYIASRQEIIEWQLIRRLSGGEVSRYGQLRGLENLDAGSHWELRPFLLGRLRRAPRLTIGELESSWAVGGSAGIDVKYHPSQGLTLDATFNPDFAQVEADQELLNLGNVEAYLAEKRAFFLEGTEVFATPLQLVYTRRIGLFPEDPPALGVPEFGDEYAALPEPSVIYGASKLTGKLGTDWTIGMLQAVTARNEVVVRRGEQRARRVVEPLSAFSALRLRHDISGGSYVGASLTAVQRLEPKGGFAALPRAADTPTRPGETLCPSGEVVRAQAACFNDAYVSSLDWRWSSKDEDWVSVGQLTQSLLRGGPPRHVLDGSVVEPDRLGFGGFTQLIKQSGNFIGDLNFEYADKTLDYSDLGYSERSNVLSWSINLEYRLPRARPLIESTLRFEYLSAHNTSGLDLGSTYYIGTLGKFTNLWEYALYLHYVQRRFDDREIGNGLALERAPTAGVDLALTTDLSKVISLGAGATCDWIETGASFSGNAQLSVSPAPELSLELGPVLNYTVGEPRFASEGTEPNQFIFGKLRAQSLSLIFRASYAFFPRLSLQGYGQLFLASGDYSSLSSFQGVGRRSSPELRLSELTPLASSLPYNPDFQEASLNTNIVLHWEYQTGSRLYAVYTHSQEIERNVELGEAAGAGLHTLRRAPSVDTLLFKLAVWWGN
jgi:hypothetical protein